MKKLIGLLGMVAATLGGGAKAQPYRVMDVSREALQSLDSSTIRKTGGIASVWMFTHYWKPQPFGTKVMDRVKSLAEFDCSTNRMRFVAIHFFADRETPLSTTDDQATAWNAIIPDAWVMKARNAACDATYTSMGTMAWDDYEAMIALHRRIALRAFPGSQ